MHTKHNKEIVCWLVLALALLLVVIYYIPKASITNCNIYNDNNFMFKVRKATTNTSITLTILNTTKPDSITYNLKNDVFIHTDIGYVTILKDNQILVNDIIYNTVEVYSLNCN